MNASHTSVQSVSSAPGRPTEIEALSNRWIVHPLSRAVAGALLSTPVTPDQVSLAGLACAAAGAWAYGALHPSWVAALAGAPFWLAWHVLDGADGDLARRSGRASPQGELMDGLCDHGGQVLLYVALALLLQTTAGGWAWVWASAAGVCHFLQANIYETARKTYRRWVYGAAWMRQAFAASGPSRVLGAIYLAVSRAANPGEERMEAALTPVLARSGEAAELARTAYRQEVAPVVKWAGWLGSNSRTVVAFLAVLIGRPVVFFLYELTVLNLVLALFLFLRARVETRLIAAVGGRDA